MNSQREMIFYEYYFTDFYLKQTEKVQKNINMSLRF